MKNRILSFVLAFVLVLGMLPVSVAATALPFDIEVDGETATVTENGDQLECENCYYEADMMSIDITGKEELTFTFKGEIPAWSNVTLLLPDADFDGYYELDYYEPEEDTITFSLPLECNYICVWDNESEQVYHFVLEDNSPKFTAVVNGQTLYGEENGTIKGNPCYLLTVPEGTTQVEFTFNGDKDWHYYNSQGVFLSLGASDATNVYTIAVQDLYGVGSNGMATGGADGELDGISVQKAGTFSAEYYIMFAYGEAESECQHTETTTEYKQSADLEIHTVTVTCASCSAPVSVITEGCEDEDTDGMCDICGGAVAIPAPVAGPWDGTTLTEPAQVDGVYQIGSGAELAWFAQTADPASKAVLTDDIDLGGQTWTAMAKLSGSFDGQGYTIKNLNGSQGLFNTVYGASNTARAEVKNVTVEGTVSGGMKIAGIAGNAYWANFTNVINRVDVTGTNQYVAGIVGYSLQGTNGSYITLTNCGNEGTITGSNNNVAGLVAYGKGAMVLTGCYNSGDITGSCSSYSSGGVGGLVGYCQGYKDASSLTDCYNTGSVNGKSGYAGGIIGTMYNGVTATNCYNAGAVTGGSGKIGAITGYAYNATSSKAVNCYYLDSSCAAAATGKPAAVEAGTAVKTADEMQAVAFLELLGEAYKKGETYPVLTWQTVEIETNAYAVTAPAGDGFTFEGEAEATDTEVYKFSIAIKDFYETTEAFAVKINGEKQEAVSVENHIYSFEYTASSDLTITVEGISYTGVKLDKSEAALYPNETLTLTATVDPNAEGTVVWASDNAAVATVENGVVTALKAGTANITASIGDVSALCRITVDHRPTVVFNGGSWITGPNQISTVTLYDVTVKEHRWVGNTCLVILDAETPRDAVVRFDKTGGADLLINGTLFNSANNTASLEEGYAKLTLTAQTTGSSVNKTMIIWAEGCYEYVPVTGIEIPAGSYTDGNYRVQAGSAIQMTAKVLPENATVQDVEWSTTASSTAITVNKSGYVQGSTMGHGNYYTLTVASAENPEITADCKIYLDWKPEDSITVSKNSMTLQVGESDTLSASVSGEDFVTNTKVTWTSSDDTIATVANGKVTGLKNGTVTVTATSYYGLTAACQVTVEGGIEECDHVDTNTTSTYKPVEGEEKHTVTVLCECGEPIGEPTTEKCADSNNDKLCDKCGGTVTPLITKLTWWITGNAVTEITVKEGTTVDAVTGCTPRSTAGAEVIYTVADSEIVTLNTTEATADDYGHAYMSFTAKKAGETTVTVAAKDNPDVKAVLTVKVTGTPQGDINGDGEVNAKDATWLLRYAAGLETNVDLDAADINGDGKVNAKDATCILIIAAKLEAASSENGGA